MPRYGVIDRLAARVLGMGGNLFIADLLVPADSPAVLRAVQTVLPNAPFQMTLVQALPGLRQGGAALVFELPGLLVGYPFRGGAAGAYPRMMLRLIGTGMDRLGVIVDPIDSGSRLVLRGWRAPGIAAMRALLGLCLALVAALLFGMLALLVSLLIVRLFDIREFPFELSRAAGVEIASVVGLSLFLLLMRVVGVLGRLQALRAIKTLGDAISAAAVTNGAFGPRTATLNSIH